MNGNKLEGDHLIYNGNVYVQADKISKQLGKNFVWDKKKNTAAITDKKDPTMNHDNVQYYRFFESGNAVPDQSARVYADRFPYPRRHGNDTSGSWQAGTYRAELWINGKKAAEGSFEIYDDQAK